MKKLIGLVLGLLMFTNIVQAKPASPTGSLSVDGNSVYGSTVTVTADWSGVKRNSVVRLQVLCQTADSSVVYGEAYTAEEPGNFVFVLGFPDPLRGTSVWDGNDPAVCRADLFSVSPNLDVQYLASKGI